MDLSRFIGSIRTGARDGRLPDPSRDCRNRPVQSRLVVVPFRWIEIAAGPGMADFADVYLLKPAVGRQRYDEYDD